MRNRSNDPLAVWLIAAACFVVWAGFSDARDLLEVEDRTNGRETVKSMSAASDVSRTNTLTLHEDRRPFGMATIVEPGYAVTKASDLDGKSSVYAMNRRRKRVEVAVVGVDDENDLALLKLTGDPVAAMVVADVIADELAIGSVVTGSTPRIGWMRIGLKSANTRPIQTRGATLGMLGEEVMSKVEKDQPVGVVVKQMVPDGPAEKAGMKEGDVVTMIDDAPVTTLESMGKVMSDRDPGDQSVVKIKRDGEVIELTVELASPSDTMDKFDRNQQMSGRTSYRKSGFSMIIQTDLPLPPTAMGGPLMTVDGQVMGVLIARADRVTTYALPMYAVVESIGRIRAGSAASDGE